MQQAFELDCEIITILPTVKVKQSRRRGERVAQQNVFGEEARKKVKSRLHGWYDLECKVKRLQRLVSEDEQELKHLRADLRSPSLVPNYEGMDMPRGSGVSDTTGNLVARIDEAYREIEESLTHRKADLAIKRSQLREIESAVDQLSERAKELIRMMYLTRLDPVQICTDLNISQAEFYRVRNAALDLLADCL